MMRRLWPLLGASVIGALLAMLLIASRMGTQDAMDGVMRVRHFDAREAAVQTQDMASALSADRLPVPWTGPSPATPHQVPLPLRWDDRFPGQAGTLDLRIDLGPWDGCTPAGLLFTRLGNQALVQVNGHTVLEAGRLGDPAHDGTKAPQYADIPAHVLECGAAHQVSMHMAASFQAGRGGTVSEFLWGPRDKVFEAYRYQYRWRIVAQTVYCIGFALIGCMALVLWMRLRDPTFATMAAAGLFGMVRNLDRIWPDVPLPWPWWGGIANLAWAWHLALIFLFTMLVIDLRRRWLERLLLAYLPLAAVLVAGSFLLHRPALWTFALALLVPLGVSVWYAVARRAVQSGKGKTMACLLAGVGGLALPSGIHDLVCVRSGVCQVSSFSLTSLSMFLFAVVMCGVVVDRYVRSIQELRRANATLDARIRAREQELEHSHALLRAEREAHAAAAERQRIMRDLHDGVGAQLVGLQSLLRQPATPATLLQSHVDAALDEMRLAVDSMQLTDGDLTTALATLRYRVLPRIQAAGLEMHWTVDEIPAIDAITPHVALQIQRILLEAVTNILKHAKARTLWVECTVTQAPMQLRLAIADDGCGLAAATLAPPGQGLKNMHARAAAIGGRLEIAARPGGGTCVVLAWPAGAGAPASAP